MKIKNFIVISIIFALLFLLTGCGKQENNTSNTISVNRLNTEVSMNDNNTSQLAKNTNNTNVNQTNIIQENTIITNEIRVGAHDFENETPQTNHEEELATFSTKLVGRNTARTRNIGITTKILNETIVENGQTFSFCEKVGKPTADKGYEEADSFDKDGNTVKTLGGGNCQVSTTLYNAVLQVPNLKVKERHEHSKDVHYVEKGKDAAVSYGSVDFKFQNNTGSRIKIYATSDLSNVNISIVKLNNV